MLGFAHKDRALYPTYEINLLFSSAFELILVFLQVIHLAIG
jgi:hypothetical protein